MSAGVAKRLAPFSDLFPKSLAPLMGIPMMEYQFAFLEKQKIKSVLINLHHKPEMIENFVQNHNTRLQIQFSDEKKEILGSAGGLAHAKNQLEDSFIYLNCGDLRSLSLDALQQRHFELKKKHGVWLTLALFEPKGRVDLYTEIQTDSNGLIQKLIPNQKNIPFFVGAAVIEKECIEHLDENKNADFVQEILNPAIQNKKAGTFLTKGFWADAGSPKGLHQAHFDLMREMNSKEFPREWKDLVLERCYELSQTIWTTHSSFKIEDFKNSKNVFWGSQDIPSQSLQNCVYYSEKENEAHPQSGSISIGNLFVQIKNN